MRLVDLSDNRRDKKPWLPADDRDVTNGLVTADLDGKPLCHKHGAMNRVDAHRSVWRCSEMYCGVGAEIVDLDVCPQCGAPQREKWSGVECSAGCGWWFCW